MTAAIDIGLIDPDTLREMDALAYRLHKNARDSEARQHLHRLKGLTGVDDAQLDERLQVILARKKSAAATRAPKFIGSGQVVKQPEQFQQFSIGFAPTDHALRHYCVGDFLRSDHPAALPDLYTVEWFTAPDESENDRRYCCEVLRRLSAGEIQPGKCATVSRRGDGLRRIAGLPHFYTDGDELSLRIEGFDFIRSPGQSQAQLTEYAKELRGRADKLDGVLK